MHQKWTLDQLIDQWTILPTEQDFIDRYKTAPNKLGAALLFKFFQIEGRFPRRQNDIPAQAVEFVARQLKIEHTRFAEYNWRGRASLYHRAAIRDHFGFREGTVADADEVVRWLSENILPHEASFEGLKTALRHRYRTLKIEPPTAARIERLARSARQAYGDKFSNQVHNRLSDAMKRKLDNLLERPTDEKGNLVGYSTFATLKRDAGKSSLKNILAEIDKLTQIRAVNLPIDLFDKVPPHVVQLFRDRVISERPREVRRHPDETRYALLTAFCWLRSQEIIDNLVNLFTAIIHRIEKTAEKTADRQLFQDVRRIRGKGQLLGRIAKASIANPNKLVRTTIYPVAGEETLQQLAKELDGDHSYEETMQQAARRSSARHYRRMAPALLKALTFRSNNDDHKPLIEAIQLIQKYVDTNHIYFQEEDTVPLNDVVAPAWRDLVVSMKDDKERVNRISYEICVFQTLRQQLRCRAVWVVGANRYRNPDEDLPADFQEKRDLYYEALQQPQDVESFINRLRQEMVDSLSTLNAGLGKNAWLTLEENRKHPIKLSPLPAQAEPLNIAQLKREIQQRWPMTPLLDMLKEVDLRTGFSDKFQTSAAYERLSPEVIRKRLLLCLYALGTNTGYERVSNEATMDALRHIRRRYINKDHLRAAIATVINATFEIRLPHIWGEATTACAADSKKFAAWDQNLLTEWHVRYRGPGIMVYWHLDKKAACIHSQVKSCSSSEVAAMIEGVLHHCTEMSVDKSYVDSHGQSTIGFAFCYLLGFQLLPRLKPIHKQRLYVPYKGAGGDLDNLKSILTRPIRWDVIEPQYNEMIKFATALRLGTAEADSILRRFTKHGIQHPTYKALLELGKAVKTVYLAQYLHSMELRREVHEGLNVVENWNSANSFIFYGRSSEISTNNRQAQEISVLSMHLLQACMVYVNTLMIQRVLLEPDWMSRMQKEDLRALSPLIYAHVNPYGRFDLDMNTRLAID